MKKRMRWIAVVLSVVCVIETMGCGTTPKENNTTQETIDTTEGEVFEGAKRFEGTTIYMIAEQQTPTEALKKQLDLFTEETGIVVDLEMAPYDNVIQKETLAFESKSGAYDIIAAPYQFLGNLVENNYIQPLDKFMEDESLNIIEDYDESDIIKGLWEASGEWQGTIYGVSANSCIGMLAYRKDLFENAEEQAAFQAAYGYELTVPTDWDTYRDVAEFFTRPKGEMLAGEELKTNFYGVSMSGKRHDATTCEWLNYAWSFGGGVFDEEGNIAINSEESVAALEYFCDLTQFAPEGIASKTWDEQTTEMQQGIAAMTILFNDCFAALEAEDSSVIAGKVGYGLAPKKEAEVAHYGGWGFYIPTDSKNPEAAWVFMQWFNTPEVQKKISLDGGFPNLISCYEDPELMSIPYWEASQKAYEISTTRPRIAQWPKMDEILMLELSNAITKETTPQQALDNAALKFTEELKDKLPISYQ